MEWLNIQSLDALKAGYAKLSITRLMQSSALCKVNVLSPLNMGFVFHLLCIISESTYFKSDNHVSRF